MKLTFEQLAVLRARLPEPTKHGEMIKLPVPKLRALTVEDWNENVVSESFDTVICEAVMFDSPGRGTYFRWKVHCEPVL